MYNYLMYQPIQLQPVDYLMIGHLSCDRIPNGYQIGGTATYSALTARALGLRVGIVTSWGGEVPLGPLSDIPMINYPTDQSTTFENVETPQGRIQYIHHVAPSINLNLIPDPWRNAPIVHLGPIAQEIEPTMIRHFPSSLICLTPQGWLRSWNANGLVVATEWPEASFVLQGAGATVISLEDVDGDETVIAEMVASSRVLVVTEGERGVRLYWHGDVRRFLPPVVSKLDTTGAGDIFATAFFSRLFSTRDPWEAARFATQLAANSVTRSGLNAIPTPEEIQESMVEVL